MAFNPAAASRHGYHSPSKRRKDCPYCVCMCHTGPSARNVCPVHTIDMRQQPREWIGA